MNLYIDNIEKLFPILLVLISLTLKAQNLVPNPSFEIHDTCPSSDAEIYYASGWLDYGGADYFNQCCQYTWHDSIVSVPYNFAGYQYAATGVAYAGVEWDFKETYNDSTDFSHDSIVQLRECTGIKLSSKLLPGIKYYASIRTSLTLDSVSVLNTASSNIGIIFSTVKYSGSTYEVGMPPLKNFAQVYSKNIITDTLNWTLVSGSFIADSAYQYVYIGNFFDNAHTNKEVFLDKTDTTTYNRAYYYIDDVCVSTDSLTCNQPLEVSNLNKVKDDILIYPIPATASITVLLPDNFNSLPCYGILYNITGEEIRHIRLSRHENNIDISSLANGAYILRIDIMHTALYKKIIVTK